MAKFINDTTLEKSKSLNALAKIDQLVKLNID